LTEPPKEIVIWLPREDEHALAASLGMCESDRELLEELVEKGQEQIARDWPGTPVIVKRWHVWRVVRAMARLGLENTPGDRSAAYAWLLGQARKQ